MARVFLTIFCTAAIICGFGCSEQEASPRQELPPPVKDVSHTPAAQVLEIVVPDGVAGMWKSVTVAVRDQQTGTEDIYSVDIGGSFLLPEENLRVMVDTFLPAFIMDGKQITSASNLSTNPAARIVIHEDEKEVFNGWLFGLYPDTHAYQHPRYNFTLISYKPAG